MGRRTALAVLLGLAACGGKDKPDAVIEEPPPACVDPVVDCVAPPTCERALCTADGACALEPDTSKDGTSCGDGQACAGGECVAIAACTDDAGCDDGNPCNGLETCDTAQGCALGTPADDGTSCGTGFLCVNEGCLASSCGDGFTTAPEECDDANAADEDGCNTDCTFSCVSTDATRNCTPADACAGQGTCDDTSHTCSAGTPLDPYTPCGTGGYCSASTCTQPMCGNEVIEPGEECDLGGQNGVVGSGCTTSCQFACEDPTTDCGPRPACQTVTCNAQHACVTSPDPSLDGQTDTCSVDLVCNAGACASPTATCGNEMVESGEQCDFGASNAAGSGCETNCQFSCTGTSCDDGNACNGTETCTTVMVGGNVGQTCSAGTPPGNGTSCGTGRICLAQVCELSTCGDGHVDPSANESCEPPSSPTCDAECQRCGDGIRGADEQCDDGNTTNLDGCDATCTFEQSHRVNYLRVQYARSTYCAANALGEAVGTNAQGLIDDATDTNIANGGITILFHFLGLDDLSGTSDGSLQLGVLDGSPVAATGYDGTNALDWWYTPEAADYDGSRTPTSQVPASLAAKVLTAGPANMEFNVNFAGVEVTMTMFRTSLRGSTGGASAPLTSSGSTPGHLASEHLSPTLTSFATIGTTSAPVELCGPTSAGSLARTQLAQSIVQYCSAFTVSHTLLDLYVHGCKYLGFIPIIDATQPDDARTAGDVYRFVTDTATRRVTACTKNGQPADLLNDCYPNAGFSSYYKLTTERVIIK